MFICIVLFYIFKFFCVRSQNLPEEDDLATYIDALKRVSEFYSKHLYLININGLFALFIANVNMKHILDNKKDVSASIKKDMNFIFDTNNKTMETFLETANTTMSSQHQEIATLFADTNTWVRHLYQFTYTYRKYYVVYHLRYILYYWDTYKKEIKNFEKKTPNQKLSNKCLASLAEYPINTKDRILRCPLKQTCNEALVNGTDFGYPLSHRIIWLMMARHGRACGFLSSRVDDQLTEKLCAIGYTEILFNLQYNYDVGDVIFEIMCGCSLGGHSEFLNKDWLNATLDLQTNSGCFKKPGGVNVSDSSPDVVSICNHYTTSLSTCTLSVAVRYIVDNKYKFYPF